MKVTIYAEGGGKASYGDFRKALSELIGKAGFSGRMPTVRACGSRNSAYNKFLHAPGNRDEYRILLVDSEGLVAQVNQPDNTAGAWRHLHTQDTWTRPTDTADDQAQLMVTTMETWLLADRGTFINHFPGMNSSSLPANTELEAREKEDVSAQINAATAPSQKGPYNKARDSFEILGKVNPDELKRSLPHFRRFVEALEAHP